MNFLKLPTIFILTMLAICSLSSKKLLAAKNDVLSVSKVTQIPTIDGISDDSVWSQAPALIVSVYEVVGKDKGRENFVTMKAIYNQTHICILAEWLDKTKDDTHKSWVWNVEKKTYTKGKDLEDVFSISFPIEGQFTGNMLSPVECTWDVWYWKAARTNPSGYAMDKHHIHTFRQPKGKAKQFPATNKRKIWIARPADKGDSPTGHQKKPSAFEGNRVDQYPPSVPTESQADVLAKGIWNDGKWTLEMLRKMNTGYDDDANLSTKQSYDMAIAVFDHEEHAKHNSSKVIKMRFESAK